MKIAIVLPTRGLVFTEVENAIEKMRQGNDIVVVRSWDKGIPDAQNYLVDLALQTDAESILFIEEDTVPPDGALLSLINADSDVTFIDYGVGGWSCSAKSVQHDTILWCGLGCTLVKRRVFEALEKPYFRTDKSLRLNDWSWIDNPMKYGGQDIWFFTHVREKGFHIKQVAGECRHLTVLTTGRPEDNRGQHMITEKDRIKKFQRIDLTEEAEIAKVDSIGNNPQLD